jgi:RNA polymerase sigma factor (sigma-70 family)
MPEPERALVEAVLAGLPGSFERLVSRYQGLCWHVVLRMVRDREDARDLLQETFLRVHRHLHQFRFESSLQTWIAQIAYSVAMRHLERKRIPIETFQSDMERDFALEAVSDGKNLESSSAEEQVMELLLDAMKGLPPLQRTLLTLYHLDELPIGEIAGITGLNEGTIKSHLFRARKWLKARIDRRTGASE